MFDYIDKSHLLEHISKIPMSLITEIIIIIFGINLMFSIIYYNIYKIKKNSFNNIHNLNTKKPISFFDFIYYSNTLFFSLGYDIIPQTLLVKFISILHLNIGFIISSIYISKIISSW